MIGRRIRRGAVLLLALLLILAAAPDALLSARAEALLPARAEAGLAAMDGESRSPADGELIARSRKKKKTATPTPVLPPAGSVTPTPVPEGPIIDPRSIADYIFAHGELPDNFITKKEARALGWDSRFNYVSDVAPGMSIGGDKFINYEGTLPTDRGIRYWEADCWYTGGRRGACRIIYSNDGRIWYTDDHYKTFTELFPAAVPGR